MSEKLTKAQRTWLAAFADGPPEEMAWLDSERRDVQGPPETWAYLSAWWPGGRAAEIHANERAGLEAYFDPGTWSLTPAGRKALEPQP